MIAVWANDLQNQMNITLAFALDLETEQAFDLTIAAADCYKITRTDSFLRLVRKERRTVTRVPLNIRARQNVSWWKCIRTSRKPFAGLSKLRFSPAKCLRAG